MPKQKSAFKVPDSGFSAVLKGARGRIKLRSINVVEYVISLPADEIC